MSVQFSVAEVFEIAQQMERNGALFYRRAAEQCAAISARSVLSKLAEMEEEHRLTFASMASDLSADERPQTVYDPNDESVQYLRAVAGGHVFDLKADPVEWLGGGRTMADMLRKAMGMEKESIVYYLGLKEIVPADLGRDKVDLIIGEEMRHLTSLSTMLEAEGERD